MTPEEKLRAYASRANILPEDVEYLVGLLAEEREACRALALAHADWARKQLCGPGVTLEYRDGQATAAEAIAGRIAARTT